MDRGTPDTADNHVESPSDADSSAFLFDFNQDVVDLNTVCFPQRSLQIGADTVIVRVEGKNALPGMQSGGSADAISATPFQSATMSINIEGNDNPDALIGDATLVIDYDEDTTVTVKLGENQAVLSGDARRDTTTTQPLVKSALASDMAASGTLMATVSQLTLNSEPVPDLTELFVAENALTMANSVVSVDQGLLNLTAETPSAESSSEAVFKTAELPANHGINSMNALLNIDGESPSDDSVTGSTYLSANLFNDTFNVDWNQLEGDIVGTVGARLAADGSWQAFASLERLGNAEGSISETIAYHEFPGILDADTDHPMFLKVNDESITFGIGELEYSVESIESRHAAWTSSAPVVYEVERNDVLIAQGDMLSAMDNNTPDDAEYFYEVFALDSMGIRSAGSGNLFLGKP